MIRKIDGRDYPQQDYLGRNAELLAIGHDPLAELASRNPLKDGAQLQWCHQNKRGLRIGRLIAFASAFAYFDQYGFNPRFKVERFYPIRLEKIGFPARIETNKIDLTRIAHRWLDDLLC